MELTELLHRIRDGDHGALDEAMPLVYHELKKVAANHLRRISNRPMETTALVHEAYMKLAGSSPDIQTRAHFFAIASRAMRQVLVDHARSASARKREGQKIELTALTDIAQAPDELILELDDALRRLNETDPRKVQLIEMRYFGGMTAEESAEAAGISVHVVRHELRIAHAWLHRELANEGTA